MADWSGEVYVYEGNGRLFHGTTKVRQDGIQEPIAAKRRVIRRVTTADYESEKSSSWWNDLRRQSAEKAEKKDVVEDTNGPPKLFKIALSYVALHISNVDSLDGFPDEMARQLFDEAYKLGRFRNPVDCVEPFRLFSEAYGTLFVSNLSLSKVTVSSSICEIITKSCGSVLEEVNLKDVTFESPGICQSLVQGFGQMPRIRRLSLVGCNLKDVDVRLLTARARLYQATGDAFAKLEELDLSDNYNISGMSVRYFRVLSNLRLLTLTGTSVESNDGFEQLKTQGLDLASTEQVSRLLSIQKGRYTDAQHQQHPLSASSFAALSTPWADRVIADWQKTLPPDDKTATENENKASKTKFKFSTFYNPTKERAKEARAKNSHAVPLVFVRRKMEIENRGMGGSYQTNAASAPFGKNWRHGKRKRGELLETESVLDQIFDDNLNKPSIFSNDFEGATSTYSSPDEGDEFASQYFASSSEDKKTKKQKTSSVFDFI